VQQHQASSQQGLATILVVFLFLVGSFIVIGGISFPILKEFQAANEFSQSKQSFYLSEAGLEDVAYRVITGAVYFSPETIILNGSTATVTVTNIIDGRDIVSQGDRQNRIRKTKIGLIEGTGVSFFYGMQADEGGVFMENDSSIIGNVYSNGTIIGESLNEIAGEVVSAGPSGLIDTIHATGSAFAHDIQDSEVDKDAYYQTILSTVVLGTEYSGSSDQATTSLPITDARIDQWKADAEAGGIILSTDPECDGGEYIIDSDTTLGPVKVECDVTVDKTGTTLTLDGAIWVVGDINTKSGPTIRINSSLGNKSIPFIADNPGDRLSGSKIILENSSTFEGSGTPGSYVLLISQNESAEQSGSEVAIDVKNSASGEFLVYASHGEILLQNNINLTEVTAYKIHLKNSAQVIYETGLASLLFTTGPGGGYVVDSWQEIK